MGGSGRESCRLDRFRIRGGGRLRGGPLDQEYPNPDGYSYSPKREHVEERVRSDLSQQSDSSAEEPTPTEQKRDLSFRPPEAHEPVHRVVGAPICNGLSPKAPCYAHERGVEEWNGENEHRDED